MQQLPFYALWFFHTLIEAVPVSSSGHMLLLKEILGRYIPYELTEGRMFLMHSSTALVLFFFILPYWLPFLMQLPHSFPEFFSICFALIIANAVTGAWYLFFQYFPPTWFKLSIGFTITTLLLLSLFCLTPGEQKYVTFTQAAVIGCVQGIALLPGISRLAATSVTAMWLGIDPLTAYIWSLTMELPLIGVALLKVIPSLHTALAGLGSVYMTIGALSAGMIGAYLLLMLNVILITHQAFGYYALYTGCIAVITALIYHL